MMRSRRAVAVEPVLHAFLSGGLSAPPFNEAFLGVAPETSGVYFLYRDGRLIFIGIAVHGTGIRQELEKHLNGAYGACTAAATTFDFERTRDPVVASREYLLAHMAQHRGRLPLCNRNGSPDER
jgi:hypothetical protein